MLTLDQIAEIEGLGIEKSLAMPDRNWHCYGLVRKYDGPEAEARARELAAPDAHAESIGNLLTTVGLNRLTSLLVGAGGQAFNAANSRLGVGIGTTAAAIGDTDLSAATGASNRRWELNAATYPQQSNGVVTMSAVYGTADANFHWQEWGIDNGTAAGTGASTAPLLNHKVTDLGTKTSAAAWTFTVTITIT